ncbi:MAG: hypothetical protein VX278_04695 [Myxococcota bacterium]|nr:hypothetical protein [Myxococcota bacterium]
MMTILLSCSPSSVDSGADTSILTPDTQQTEDTWTSANCEMWSEPSHVDFPRIPAMSAVQSQNISLFHDCEEALYLLSAPQDWIDDPRFAISVPSTTQIDPEDALPLTLQFTPGTEEEHTSTANILYMNPTSPLQIPLTASVGPALKMVLVGNQLRRAISYDYGVSVESDTTGSPNPESNQRGICWGDGRFIVVGGSSQGYFWSSQNGLNWQEHTIEGEAMGDCAYGNGLFVSFTDAPWRSIAGIQWEEGTRTPWLDSPLKAITFGDNTFVAVGSQGRVATTSSGQEWERDGGIGNFDLFAVAYGGGRFVTVGNFGAVAWSEDQGFSWKVQYVGTGTFQRVIYGNGSFYASNGSQIYRSENGEIWTEISTFGVKPIASIGSLFIGTKGQSLYHSQDDCETWQIQHTFSQNIPFNDVVIAGE